MGEDQQIAPPRSREVKNVSLCPVTIRRVQFEVGGQSSSRCCSLDPLCLLDSHLARRYPCIPFNEDVEMLDVPIVRQACRRFRISKLVKGTDEGDVVVSGLQESEGSKSWHMVQERDKAFLHPLLECRGICFGDLGLPHLPLRCTI